MSSSEGSIHIGLFKGHIIVPKESSRDLLDTLKTAE
jgi:hypothetical protein